MDYTPVRCDGMDADFFWFSTPSWTRKGIEHTITVCRRTGVVACTCEDATYRAKRGFVLDTKAPGVCKHVKRLMHSFAALFTETNT